MSRGGQLKLCARLRTTSLRLLSVKVVCHLVLLQAVLVRTSSAAWLRCWRSERDRTFLRELEHARAHIILQILSFRLPLRERRFRASSVDFRALRSYLSPPSSGSQGSLRPAYYQLP